MSEHLTISPQSPITAPAAVKDVMPVQEQLQNEPDLQSLQKTSIQFNLVIGAPNDPLENEADAMADTIMRIPEQNFIQRKCAGCEEEEKIQRKSSASFIQTKESTAGTVASDVISNKINSSKGSGNNMDSHTQSFMQSRFGADFREVKIHTDGEAIQMNRELSAKAFTVGNDIYFNEGQYNPDSGEGKHLLAHELTHTVQQGGARKINKKTNFISKIEKHSDAPKIQCSRLRDFNDSNQTHDPSNLSDSTIRQTNEFRAYMDRTLVWQTTDRVTEPEALLACRLLLRDMRGGVTIDWESGGRRYLLQARMQLGTLHFTESLENSHNWAGQPNPGLQNTDFGRWLLGGGPEPNNSASTMNCWEVVMFSAYQAGFTTEARLRVLYTAFSLNYGGANHAMAITAFENTLRRGPEQVYDRNNPNSPKPLPGDLVIFNNLNAHVAIAIGENRGTHMIGVMSLFIQNSRHVARTTVEALLDGGTVHTPVRFFSPKW